MDDSGRIVSRREFGKYVLVAAGSLMAGRLLAAPGQDIEKYREKLFGKERFSWYSKFFGKEPILVDGDLEKLSYKLYEKDRQAFQRTVNLAGIFLQGGRRQDYDAVYGRQAAHYWKKDRDKVVASLLKVINVPDYIWHEYIRRKLREDGILDFHAHKRNANQFIDQQLGDLVKMYDTYVVIDAAKRKFREMARNEAGNVVTALKLLYIATLPINSLKEYKKLEDNIDEILDEGLEALDNSANIAEGLLAKDNVKVVHQTQKLVGRFNSLFSKLGDLIGPDSITRTQLDVRMGRRKKVTPFEGRDVYWFDYLAEEWDDLGFDAWKSQLERKVDGALQ